MVGNRLVWAKKGGGVSSAPISDLFRGETPTTIAAEDVSVLMSTGDGRHVAVASETRAEAAGFDATPPAIR